MNTKTILLTFCCFCAVTAWAQKNCGAENQGSWYFSEAKKLALLKQLIKSHDDKGLFQYDGDRHQYRYEPERLLQILKQDVKNNNGPTPATVNPTHGDLPEGMEAPPHSQIAPMHVERAGAGRTNDSEVLVKQANESIREMDVVVQVLNGCGPLKETSYSANTSAILTKVLNQLSETGGNAQAGIPGMDAGLSFLENQIIYGITDFAIKRAKEELMEAHVNDLIAKLDADPVMPKLIPNALLVLHQFQQENALSLAKYGDRWKVAFEADFRNLPVAFQSDNLVNAISDKFHWKNEDDKKIFQSEVTPLITTTDAMVYQIALKKHPVEVTANLASEYLLKKDKHAELPVVRRAVVAADMLLSVSGSMCNGVYYPADWNVVKSMSEEEWNMLVNLFLTKNQKAIIAVGGEEAFDKLCENHEVLKQQIYEVIADANTMALLMDKPSSTQKENTDGKKLSADEAFKLMELSVNQIHHGLELVKAMSSDGLKARINYYQGYGEPVLKSATQIGQGLANKQYSEIVNGVTNILKLIEDSVVSKQRPAKEVQVLESRELRNPLNEDDRLLVSNFKGRKITRADGVTLVLKERTVSNPYFSLASTLQYLTRYGSFMLNILSAKDGDAVAKALDEIIPRGQYKLKNTTAVSASLSLYPGGLVGVEKIPNSSASKWVGSAAFHLPIGIDVNFGLPNRRGVANSSLNVFIYPLDFGAVLAYRLHGNDTFQTATGRDTVSKDPVLGFKQLLSPGAQITWHFPKSPVVIGINANYSPELRKIKNGSTETKAGAIRVGLVISVDVTAIHIALTKSKKYRLQK
ncbi:MAG: hypothetical protein U0T73_04680 [Chitinophagales bacterium]